jgi:phage terminase large subunit GpA-like protein
MVDSGYREDIVMRWMRGRRGWLAVKGFGQGQDPTKSTGKVVEEVRGVIAVREQIDGGVIGFVDTDECRRMVHERLVLPAGSACSRVLPHAAGSPGECVPGRYPQHLVAERLVKGEKDGRPQLIWKRVGRRNDWLDCSVYALAGAMMIISRRGIIAREEVRAAATAPAPAPQGGQRVVHRSHSTRHTIRSRY